MRFTETNTFSILNLRELSSDYRLYEIRGLHPDQDEYYRNLQVIVRRLSSELKNPVTVIERDSKAFLVVRADANGVPNEMNVIRRPVKLLQTSETLKLDYTKRSELNDIICTRFLTFAVQAPLYKNLALWQPSSGGPFYFKKPTMDLGGVKIYEGFTVRAVVTEKGGLGLCVDISNKYVSSKPLPLNLERDNPKPWKGRNVIYHYGHTWYEIKITDLFDYGDVWDYSIYKDGVQIPLMKFIQEEGQKPIPEELRDLPEDAQVVLYLNNRGEERGAPAPLCFPVYGTDTQLVARNHAHTQLDPTERLRKIIGFRKKYLGNLQVGEAKIQLDAYPERIRFKKFLVPDLKFGNDYVLSVRNTPDTHSISIEELGEQRRALISDPEVGIYKTTGFYRQYLVLPQSVWDSYGSKFETDLKDEVKKLHPTGNYAPVRIIYDDRAPHNFRDQGHAVLKAIKDGKCRGGHAVIMVHDTTQKKLRKEDQLAAVLTRKLREDFDIIASIIHVNSSKGFYMLDEQNRAKPAYIHNPKEAKWRKGYLRLAALNKILLPNGNWPFVLNSRLHADVVIGFDVKHHTAGFVVMDCYGANVRYVPKTSKQKERLRRDQTAQYFRMLLEDEIKRRDDQIKNKLREQNALETVEEIQATHEQIKNVVVHRDGRIFAPEIAGIKQAFDELKYKLHPEATLTIVEISKTSPVPLRLFNVNIEANQPMTAANPAAGLYHLAGARDGYVCNTGFPFLKGDSGTVKPLQIKYVLGGLTLEKCLEDVFYLSSLSWTRPEGCIRHPITTKLNDRMLYDIATDYDEDEFDFADAESSEEEVHE